MEKVNHYPFGYPLVVFESAIAHNTEVNDLLKKVMSLSTLITAGKGQIVKTKRSINAVVVTIKHCKLLRAYNLHGQFDDYDGHIASYRKSIKEYTEELRVHQKDLRKIYAEHNKTVEELKYALDKFARICAIRHTRRSQLSNVSDVNGFPQNNEEQSLTTLNLSRVGVLTLIKKLSDEIKAKPTCNNFTVTINSGVTKS